MERIFKNTFLRGIQGDLDKSITPAENYIGAENITLTGDGKFLAAENIAGTLKVDEIVEGFSGKVLGVYASRYVIDGNETECLTIFVIEESVFTIYCYDLIDEVLITLYTEAQADSNNVIDLVVYPEGNVDILYFTDGVNEIRKIRCDITTPYTLTKESISLQRRGTIATVELDTISLTGGTLLTGSYQFSLRLYNEDTRNYSKWTIPSTPVIISSDGNGSYNLTSSKIINIAVDSIAQYTTDNYTHYQFAVIENLTPVSQTFASLQKLEALATPSFTWEYSNNTKIGEIPLADIVVDLAAVAHVKTLAVKNNRLFAGNIEYWNRTYDRTPAIEPGANSTILVDAVPDPTDDEDVSKHKGHFRDEVYRFYVSYFDEYYNFSRPYKLDLTPVTGNEIANGDFRFPKGRGGTYHITNASSEFQYLNLKFEINNHPSWAKGFSILRAKRKKRIKFQSPVVPMSNIEGCIVQGTYPDTPQVPTTGGLFSDVNLTNATPMNPIGTYVPKNFLWTENRNIIKFKNEETVGGSPYPKGACFYEAAFSSPLHQVFPSQNIYDTSSAETNNYEINTGDSLDPVDVSFLKADYLNSTKNSGVSDLPGDTDETSYAATLYSSFGDYYYTYGGSEGALNQPGYKLVGAKPLDNYGEGTSLNGKSICQFSNLETGGLNWFQSGNNQKSLIIETEASRPDISWAVNYYSWTTNTGSSPNNVVPTAYYSNTSSIGGSDYFIDNPEAGLFATDKSGYDSSKYVSAVEIANIVDSNIGDTRYGDSDELHDLVYTGTSYVFSAAELVDVIDDGDSPAVVNVRGGDCYVSRHTFKVTDNHYGLAYVRLLHAGLPTGGNGRYRFRYAIPGGGNYTMPYAYKNMSQVLHVFLESEYNGELTATKPVDGTPPVYTTDDKFRVCFNYGYNFGYLKQSDQKAFTPYNSDEIVNTTYPARILYSDQKVYNTDVQGFDIFRISNLKDLEETYRGITKLALAGDSLYSVQERGVAYLPVESSIIETTDVNTLSIRSGTVVDIPNYLSKQFGSQHLKSVIVQDNSFFLTDNFNKALFKVSGNEMINISDLGVATEFKGLLTSTLEGDSIYGIYDNPRRQYIVYRPDGTFCWVFDDRLGVWVGEYDFNSDYRLYDGAYTNNDLYVLGKDSANLNLYKMYKGTPGQLLGRIVTPSITVSVNDNFDVPKTFDNFVIYSSETLATADITSERETGVVVQEVLNQDIEVARREGAYRVYSTRDSAGARLRGTRATLKLKWKTLDSYDEEAPPEVPTVSLSQVVTKYRESSRKI